MSEGLPSLDAFVSALAGAPGPDQGAIAGASERNGMLTKPPGALGRLEELAIWYAGWQGNPRPEIKAPQVVIFAGNHGVTARGISAFPAEVTAQMVANFKAGGAAVNQLSALAGAKMDIVAIELERPTKDFCEGPAMSDDELLEALNIGWCSVAADCDLLVTGEMGIGNTTAAAAISYALFGGKPADWAGRGTGLNEEGVALKARVIADAVALHGARTGMDVLRCLGGREIAAMAGSIARARVRGIPVILDGYIGCAAAACLLQDVPAALDHAIAGHCSAEGAHPVLLQKLGKEPLLSLGLRLGEGSGAALAINILKGAVVCHSGMSTFAEAGVSEG